MKYHLTPNLITDRMNSLNLSERAIVRNTQIPQFQFRQARQSHQLDGHISLAQINRLASELGISVPELLAPPDPVSTPVPAVDTEDDVQTLVPILVSAPSLVSVAHAARILRWKRERIEAALAAIPAALEGTGLRLQTSSGRVKIAASDSPDKAVLHAIGRLQTVTAGLNRSQARTLLRIVNGEAVFHRNIGNQEKLSLGALKNMGCIEVGEKAQYQPTVDLCLVLPDIEE
jgi:hypothetical protein